MRAEPGGAFNLQFLKLALRQGVSETPGYKIGDTFLSPMRKIKTVDVHFVERI